MNLNGSLNLMHEISKVQERIPAQEYTLGRALKQPFCNTNSGSRKIMQGIQMEQAVQVINPEAPIITTGYENQLGYLSSNFIKADREYKVITKIPKYSFAPNYHYWLILSADNGKYFTVIERTPYCHITEFFGYLFNNDYLDGLLINDIIPVDTVMKKTLSYDEYNNRAEGLNLTTMYIACEDLKEDPIVISESAAKKFACPLIDKIEIKINDNDILINLYGDDKKHEYKTFPDILEYVKNNIFCAVRRELKDEEALYAQSWDKLKTILMNDKKFLCDDGQIIDINVYCNNIEKLDNSMYNSQIRKYYIETKRCAKEFVDKLTPYFYYDDKNNLRRDDIEISYELDVLFTNMQLINQGVQYIQDKVFSNIIMEVYIQYTKPLRRGDKIIDRYGGKGVISKVKPDDLMPKYLRNGKWEPVDVLYSMCTCVNRLNDGQLFETSITYIGWKLLEYIDQNIKDYNEAYALIVKYVSLLNPLQAQHMLEMYKIDYGTGPDPMDDEYQQNHFMENDNQYSRDIFIEQMIHDGAIMVSIPPISSNMSIDKLANIYKEFPFISKYCPVCVPQKGSDGKHRMVYTRRPLVIGKKYIFRLKQLVEEKFSAVSLASTNIRNENSKSRLSKTHNARFPSTPIKSYGEMESSTLASHLTPEVFIEEFLLNSSSPEARRLNQELLTGDPFAFDIKLDENCVAQSSDMLMAYLKVLGLKLTFSKIKKFKPKPVLKSIVDDVGKKYIKIADYIPKEMRHNPENNEITKEEKINMEIFAKELSAYNKQVREKQYKEIVRRIPGFTRQDKELSDYKEKLRSINVDPKYILKI